MSKITDPKTPRSAESLDFYDGPSDDQKDRPGWSPDFAKKMAADLAETKKRISAKVAEDLAAGKRTSYGVWEDDPTILHFYGDGSASGHIHNGTEWKEVHPADVGHKARVISEADFKRRFPDIGLPVFRK